MIDYQKTAKELRATGKRLLDAAEALDPGKKHVTRVLSADARKRIADAQRERWAKVRKANKKAA